MLNADQKRFYADQGYLVIRGLFPADEIAAMRRDLFAILEDQPAPAAQPADSDPKADGDPKAPCDDEVVDADCVLKQFGGNTAMLSELAEVFFEQSADLLAAIDEAIGRRDASAICRSAHLLAGSAANFHSPGVVACARRLEQSANHADWPGARLAFSSLKAGLDRLKPALDALTEGDRRSNRKSRSIS